jgi:MerR family transcriptional regulator, copper efflux regulator
VQQVRIAEAAAAVGVEPHVLRHWEDEGVITPSRVANGYRDYDADAMTRLRIVVACREIGMALRDIRLVLDRHEPTRAAAITAERRRVAAQIRALAQTKRFLDHVIDCLHPLVSRCPDCSTYAGTAVGRHASRSSSQ